MSKPPRSLWPISIIAFFAVAITFFAGFVIWVLQLRDDLVTPDYYEREVRFQTQLDTLNRSQPFAAQTVVTFEPASQEILITLPADQTPGATGTIQLYRPSDARLDRDLPLALNAAGVQRVDARDLRPGLWKVRVQWNVSGADYFLDQPVIVTSG
jgi:nitrogen fixation protein FixH